MSDDYQDPECTLTLRQGLRSYFDRNPNLLDPDDPAQMSADAAELFRGHDTVHVVFGTDTSVMQEALTDTWAMAATDVGWRRYMAYLKNPEAVGIFKEIGWFRAIGLSLLALPAVVRVLWRARRMAKPWPWKAHDAYLDRPLADIRREFGIELVTIARRSRWEENHAEA